MGIEDLIFWLFLGFALFSRVFAWIIERLRGGAQAPSTAQQPESAQRPEAARQPESIDDFFDDEWDEPPRERPAPITTTAPITITPAPSSATKPTLAKISSDASAIAPFTAADQGRQLRQKLGLDQRSALQRSVLLMSVLGPCRANEHDTDARNRVSF